MILKRIFCLFLIFFANVLFAVKYEAFFGDQQEIKILYDADDFSVTVNFNFDTTEEEKRVLSLAAKDKNGFISLESLGQRAFYKGTIEKNTGIYIDNILITPYMIINRSINKIEQK